MKKLSIIILMAVSHCIMGQTAPVGRVKLNQMIQACEQVRTAVFSFKKYERIDGQQVTNTSYVRLQAQPLKVYIRLEDTDDKGVELLYLKGQNDNQVLVNPNGFPYMNFNFSPYSARLRKGSHHTILEAGFLFFGNLIKKSLERGILNDQKIIYEGLTEWQGKNYEKIILRTDDFGWKKIVLKTDESAYNLGKSLLVSGYAIMARNNLDVGVVKAGTSLWVPTAYGKEIILLLDPITHLPMVQEVRDDKGQFERYEFKNLILNPTFDTSEFTKEHKLYNFK